MSFLFTLILNEEISDIFHLSRSNNDGKYVECDFTFSKLNHFGEGEK